MFLEVQGCTLPFWKPPINISMEPDLHGCCSAVLKNCIRVSRLMHRTVALKTPEGGEEALKILQNKA